MYHSIELRHNLGIVCRDRTEKDSARPVGFATGKNQSCLFNYVVKPVKPGKPIIRRSFIMWFTTLSIPSWGPSRDLFNLPSPWETTSWSAWTTSEERTIAHHHSRWPVVPSTVRKSSLSSTYAVTSYGEIGSQTSYLEGMQKCSGRVHIHHLYTNKQNKNVRRNRIGGIKW